jgi:hypothetical protein
MRFVEEESRSTSELTAARATTAVRRRCGKLRDGNPSGATTFKPVTLRRLTGR